MAQVSYGTITITDTTDLTTYIRYAKKIGTGMVSTDFQLEPTSDTHYIAVLNIPSTETVPAWNSSSWKWSEFIGTDGVSVLGTREIYYLKTNSNTVTPPSNGSDISQTSELVENQWTKSVPTYKANGEYWTCIQTHLNASPTWVYSEAVLNQGLTDSNYNSAMANSIAQQTIEEAQGALSQAASNINSITRLWYLTDTATPPNKPTTHITQTSTGVIKQWTINKPTVTNYRYYYYCDETCTGGGIYNWSDVVADTSSLLPYELGLINAKIKNHWWDGNGLHFASGINNAEVTTTNSSTYGYIGTLGLSGLILGYNSYKTAELLTNALNFYQPPIISGNTAAQGNLTMSLSGNSLTFYGSTADLKITTAPTSYTTTTGGFAPTYRILLDTVKTESNKDKILVNDIIEYNSNHYQVGYVDSSYVYLGPATSIIIEPKAILNYAGLVLSKGGIQAGTVGLDEGLYLSTEKYNTALQIGSSDQNKDDWKLVLGKNFGVDENGNLYAAGGIIGGSDSYINITKTGIELIGSNINIEVDYLNNAVKPSEWLQSHEIYEPTEDTTKINNKNYYQKIDNYEKTTDTDIDIEKSYYTRSGEGTDESPYEYTLVIDPNETYIDSYYEYILYKLYISLDNYNPKALNLYEYVESETLTSYLNTHFNFTSEGLNIVANPTEYYITLAPDGMYVYNNDEIISKFGENIEFSSVLPQRIGDDNAYIQFTPADVNNNIPASIDIVATNIQIGNGTNVAEALAAQHEASEDAQLRLQGQIDTQTNQINQQQQIIDNINGYVTINTNDSYIRVGKKNSNSYVQIDGNQLKVAINIDNKDVAYMTGDRFYAPSAVVSNLYMKTDLSSNSPIGAIGWVMRTNGHLSLKLIS